LVIEKDGNIEGYVMAGIQRKGK